MQRMPTVILVQDEFADGDRVVRFNGELWNPCWRVEDHFEDDVVYQFLFTTASPAALMKSSSWRYPLPPLPRPALALAKIERGNLAQGPRLAVIRARRIGC